MPLEIPGTVLKFLDKGTEKVCPHCRRKYQTAKLSKTGGEILKRCPHCNRALAKYNMKAFQKKVARRGIIKNKCPNCGRRFESPLEEKVKGKNVLKCPFCRFDLANSGE